jgi:hypothetical protein
LHIKTYDELMTCLNAASGDVGRLNNRVKEMAASIDFIPDECPPREGRFAVYKLLDEDPLALRPDDPLSTLVRTGYPDKRILSVGIFPQSADRFWHGVRLLSLLQEVAAEREIETFAASNQYRDSRKSHIKEMSALNKRVCYDASRLVLDILDGHAHGDLRRKTKQQVREGNLTGHALKQRMRAYANFLVKERFPGPATKSEIRARELCVEQCLPALLARDPYN